MFPQARFLFTDLAENMLAVVRERFAGERGVSFEVSDYTQALPAGSFDAIVSALSIHHLEDAEKAQPFQRICRALHSGGVFANYD